MTAAARRYGGHIPKIGAKVDCRLFSLAKDNYWNTVFLDRR